jgi:hypothetical protein
MEAILGTLSGVNNKLLLCANPTKNSGTFFDSHNKDRELYKCHRVSSRDSKRASKDNITMLERKYGKDSDVVRVRVDGEFPKREADAFMPLEFVELATEKEIQHSGNILHIGIDVARFGDDETGIVPQFGWKVLNPQFYNGNDTMVTVGKAIYTAKGYMKTYPQITEVWIKVDDSGVGGGVTDRLREVIADEGLPFKVFPVINNGTSEDEHYDNLGTEAWAQLRDIFEDNFSRNMRGEAAIVQIPNDEKLIGQLTTRKFKFSSRGRMVLERKEDMKKRGLTSPDRADALVLAFYQPHFVETIISSMAVDPDDIF